MFNGSCSDDLSPEHFEFLWKTALSDYASLRENTTAAAVLLSVEEELEYRFERLDVFLEDILSGKRTRAVWESLLFWDGTLYLLLRHNHYPPAAELLAPVFEKAGCDVVRVTETRRDGSPRWSWTWWCKHPEAREFATDPPGREAPLAEAARFLVSRAALYDPEGEAAAYKAKVAAATETVPYRGHQVLRSKVNGNILAIDGLAVYSGGFSPGRWSPWLTPAEIDAAYEQALEDFGL